MLEIPLLASLKWNVAALRFQLAMWQVAYRDRKGGYNENERRVGPGQPGGGEWTDGGGAAGNSKPPDVPEGGRAPLRVDIYVPLRTEGSGDGSGSTDGPPLGDPPSVPDQEPETTQALNQFAKEVAWWTAKALAREAANPAIGTLLNVIDAVYWGYKASPYVRAYLDPPKTLDELHRAVSNPTRGYDIHHIVEKTPAKGAGYPRHMIDAPENLVRISTLKHWQITGWYMRQNYKYQGLSPREYLRDKDWAERTKVGREALIEYGVLKP